MAVSREAGHVDVLKAAATTAFEAAGGGKIYFLGSRHGGRQYCLGSRQVLDMPT